jgi:hypothetical protein
VSKKNLHAKAEKNSELAISCPCPRVIFAPERPDSARLNQDGRPACHLDDPGPLTGIDSLEKRNTETQRAGESQAQKIFLKNINKKQ